MKSKSSFVCPYCFAKVNTKDVKFRCTNKRCVDVDDIELTRYENGNLNMPMLGKTVFQAKGNLLKPVPDSGKCPECSNETHKHVCCYCHNELPESSLNGKDMIISIVGARGTGKSHYVGVIIKELRDRISVAFDGSWEGFGDSYARWEESFGNRLYKTNEKLDLTQSSLQNSNNGAFRPLIFKLKLRKNAKSKNLESFTFVFFDTAGEDLNDADTMSTVNRYICSSAGIIFLLDPMQIPDIANRLDDNVVKCASAIDVNNVSDSDLIINRVSQLIRNSENLSESKKIDIPVAAVFSKFDAIQSVIPSHLSVHNTSPHCASKIFDKTDSFNVSSDIESLLQEFNATAFTSQLNTNYSNYSYFAASALGLNNNPTPDGRIQRPRPHRIEDALLWILNQNDVIKAK